MLAWKDETSYSRNETNRTPKTWVAKVGSLRLYVTRHIDHGENDWLCSCDPFFDIRMLESKEIDEAKAEAVVLLKHELERCMKPLSY